MDTSYAQSRWTIPLTQRPLLREALESDVDEVTAPYEQRRLIRKICSLPEVRALPPEQFVVAFKNAVNDTATRLGIAEGPPREQLVSRLVSIAIEEFFHEDGDPDIRFGQKTTWSERLHLAAIRRNLNRKLQQAKGDVESHQSKDERCRGMK